MSELSIESKRKMISDQYDGLKWKERCRRMPDNQVYAVYASFLRQGKFDPARKQNVKNAEYQQMTIFDYDYDI